MPRDTLPSQALQPVGVAIVGLGFGAVHAAAYRDDPRARVVALCGRDQARTRVLAEKLEVPRFSVDWRNILDDSDVHVVSLAVPAPVQAEIGAAALAAGKHVFFEKPLAGSLRQAKELASLARAHNRVTSINFEFPELQAFREAKRLLEAHALGALRHVDVVWRVETYANKVKSSNWKTTSAAGGGALNLFASHCFYYLEWMLGPMSSMLASLQRAPGDSRAGDTLNTVVMEAASGLPVVLTIATDAWLGPGHHIEIYGDEGRLLLENRGSDYLSGFRLLFAQRTDSELHELPLARPSRSSHEDGRIGATASIQRRMLDAIGAGGRCAPGADEGVRVQALLDCARLSSKRSARIAVVDADGEGE